MAIIQRRARKIRAMHIIEEINNGESTYSLQSISHYTANEFGQAQDELDYLDDGVIHHFVEATRENIDDLNNLGIKLTY